jgi:hypothetical protein
MTITGSTDTDDSREAGAGGTADNNGHCHYYSN